MEESAYEVGRQIAARKELIDSKSDEERMVTVIGLRLKLLEPHLSSWSQAMTLGMHPSNAPTTARNLALLADEMCHTINLTSTDARWYTDRAVVGAVYGAAEVFMLQDKSHEYSDTKAFVRRRVGEAFRLVDPAGASKVDAHIQALASVLPIKPESVAMAASLAAASAQVALGAVASLFPAGEPLHRPRTTVHSPPREDPVATPTEAAAFDPAQGSMAK
jgi:ubiquinone biosynthesis protein COQ9